MVAAVVLGSALAAWLGLFFLHTAGEHGSATGPTSPSHGPHRPMLPAGADLVVLAGGWALMVLAMMLPPALPLVQTVRRLGEARRATVRVVGGAVAGFMTLWVAAGAGYLALDVLFAAGRASAGVRTAPAASAGVVVALLVAGAYQFSPAKKACLTACRSPQGMAMTRWSGHRPARDAWRIGLAYAGVCVGCCWALMLVTLVAGMAAMPVMVVMAVVMAAERLVPRTRPLVPAIAVGLFAAVPLVLLWPGAASPGVLP